LKRLYLTAVVTVPSEEGQKRIDEALEKETLGVQNIFRDDYGRSRGDYEEMNMRIPSYFDEEEAEFYSKNPSSEIDENGFMNLAPEELEYEFLDYLVPLKNIIDVTDTQEIGSIIILKNGMSVHVEETVEHINFMIYMLTMSWWDRLKFRFSNLFARKIN